MSSTINYGAWTIEILREDDDTIAPGQVAVRIDGHELTGRPDQLAELGRLLYHELGKVTLPSNTWQILAVGNAVTGYEFYGPFPLDDPGDRAYARIRVLEIREQSYAQASLHPLDELPPIDPDPVPATSAQRTNADITVPGVGTLKASATYVVTVTNGEPRYAYALIGGMLIEACDVNKDGTPDWSTSSVCAPGTGDENLFFPAMALLLHLNAQDRSDLSLWHRTIRAEFDAAFTAYAWERLIAGWHHEEASGGYRINTWQQDGSSTEILLHTPEQTRAFLDGLQAAVNARSVNG